MAARCFWKVRVNGNIRQLDKPFIYYRSQERTSREENGMKSFTHQILLFKHLYKNLSNKTAAAKWNRTTKTTTKVRFSGGIRHNCVWTTCWTPGKDEKSSLRFTKLSDKMRIWRSPRDAQPLLPLSPFECFLTTWGYKSTHTHTQYWKLVPLIRAQNSNPLSRGKKYEPEQRGDQDGS